MFRILLISCVTTCLAANLVLAQPNAQPKGAPPPQQAARPLPDIKLKTIDAKGLSLRRYRGKGLVLFLFSTESTDCLRMAAVMNNIQNALGPKGLQVVGIGINNNAPYTLAGWTARVHPTYPLGFLDADVTVKLLAVKSDERPFVPIVMFVDATGMVRYQFFGDSPIFKGDSAEKALLGTSEYLLRFQKQLAPKAPPKEESKQFDA